MAIAKRYGIRNAYVDTDLLRIKEQSTIDGRFLQGQPFGITRPVRQTGKLLCRFKASEWTPYGSATLADHTGYDSNGNITGVVSRTGHPTLLKVTPGDDSNEGCVVTNFASTFFEASLNGLFGLWVYLETQPGYEPGGSPTGTLSVELSTNGAFTNCLYVAFNTNALKEGWNFLVFRMRNFSAYQASSGAEELHPFGVGAISYGSGAGANILANPINAVRIMFNGAGITGKSFYLDSMWTGFDTQAQFVLGYDTTHQSVLDIALPIFNQYGWKGYVTINGGYWDGVSSRILSNYNVSSNATTFAAAKWDTINHGLRHLPGVAASPNMAQLTDAAEIAYEVMATYGIMKSLGLERGAEFYAAPQNSTSRLAEKVIRECGFKIQRAFRGNNTFVTPWGVPNLSHIGSISIGATGENAYNRTYENVSSSVQFGSGGIGNLQKMKNIVDIAVAYGSTVFCYTHGLETAGDDGTGNSLPAVTTNCIASLQTKFLEYVKEKENAGLVRVPDGFTGFYYGVGR